MESNSKKSQGMRAVRFLGRSLPALVLAGVLAACGGGGGGGGGDRQVAPKDCLSTKQGDGTGFAFGGCSDRNHNTVAHVFQPISSLVTVRSTSGTATGYRLQLIAPSHLSQHFADDSFEFGASNLTPLIDGGPHRHRSILGLLEGAAYEGPNAATNSLSFPYVSIADFSRASELDTRAQATPLDYSNFGIWERFPTTDPDEGYMGPWYAPRDDSIDSVGPGTAVTYVGNAVGIVGSDLATASQPVREGLSARVEIEANGTGILTGRIFSLFVSTSAQDGSLATTNEIVLDPIVFGPSSAAPGVLEGSLTTTPGPNPDIAGSGQYQAEFFSKPGDPGREISGQFRFATSDGLLVTGSFGVRRP